MSDSEKETQVEQESLPEHDQEPIDTVKNALDLQDPVETGIRSSHLDERSTDTDSSDDEKEACQLRKGNRKKKMTPKALEEKLAKSSKLFWRYQKGYLQILRETETTLRDFCSHRVLKDLSKDLQNKFLKVEEAYYAIKALTIPEANIGESLDSLESEKDSMIAAIEVRLDKPGTRSHRSSNSTTSRLSERLVQANADVAARKAELEHTRLENDVEDQLKQLQLEEEQRRKEADARIFSKQKELKEKRLEKLLRIDEAKLKALEEAESICSSSGSHCSSSHSKIVKSPKGNLETDTSGIFKAITESLSLSKLPAPEPAVFTGDPLQFTDWKSSFVTLIESRCSSPCEKMFYLKRYVSGEAKRALESYFLKDSKAAYEEAWKTLTRRFGDPFVVGKTFREKLYSWPRINTKDIKGLLEFADFLKSCRAAIPYVQGLNSLDDCLENQRILEHLPEWLTNQWNRRVHSISSKTGGYPSFSKFVDFIAEEADIASNPISSLHALRSSESTAKPISRAKEPSRNKEPNRNKANVFTTSSNVKKVTSKVVVCNYCEGNHQMPCCPDFSKKSMDEKRSYVWSKRLCFGCLKPGHQSKECRNRQTCQECQLRHPTCLHDDKFIKESDRTAPKTVANGTGVSLCTSQGQETCTSPVVPVWVSSSRNPVKEVLVYALLDTQSDSTFVTEDVSRALEVNTTPVNLKLTTLTSQESVVQCFKASGLQVRGYYSSDRVPLPAAYTKDYIPLERSHIPTHDTANSWEHLSSISEQLPPLMNCEAGLLIGYNCSRALTPRQVISGQDYEPYAQKTDLGWSIVGCAHPSLTSGLCHRVTTKEMPFIKSQDVLKVLETDFVELQYDEKLISQDDLTFIKKAESGIRMNSERHLEMPLPFRERPCLPDNRHLAVVRLKHLKSKLDRNELYRSHYTGFMGDIIDNGHAEKVPDQGIDGNVWYIPHHGVYHPRKPDKLRVVFDGSARYKNTSLNEHLLSGPDLTNGLVGVLCRFRKHSIAIACDVAQMFHQFHVDKQDRDFLRFLWWEGGNTDIDPTEYRMKVHLFGAASSPGCANYCLKHLATQNKDQYPLASKFISRDFYVDDGLTSVPDVETAVDLVQQSRDLCSLGSLQLHKFVSNDRTVMESIPGAERVTDLQDIDLAFGDLPVEQALGVRWFLASDSLGFKVTLKDKPGTRRGILSTVASLFDPLGFVSPFILDGKRILQTMCRRGVGWDDPLPNDLSPLWERWKSGFSDLENISLPRCFTPSNFGKVVHVQLHNFSDASLLGYGECSYLRLIDEHNTVHCCLVLSKSRVAPSKVTTIPRLELTAAVTAVKISKMLKEELEFQDIEEHFWTDSKIVIGYISNEARRFHTFIANRVQRIRQTTIPSQWHYVPTKENPADLASRGSSPQELTQSKWFQGPDFLWEKELHFEECNPNLQLGDPEIRATSLSSRAKPAGPSILERISRFSCWNNAVTGFTLLRKAIRERFRSTASDFMERQETESWILQTTQREYFYEETAAINAEKAISGTSKLVGLQPFADDRGVLRVGGRLRKSTLPDGMKHPIILPRKSPVTTLLIAHFHERSCHQGRGQTLNFIRSSGYWIVNASKAVADLISACVICRKTRRPTEEQKMADLPSTRVEPSAPFTYVGIDCFGPFKVKRNRSEVKRYGLIFTCFCSRGVHIEMLDDLSTDAFINGLRCFIAIRGTVRQIRCDQGSNFIGADNELKLIMKEMKFSHVKTFLEQNQCEFIFNTPHSSHTGGVWERQIRTVRNVLRSTIDLCPGRLDDSSLRTIFYEAMAIVNSRPLTPVDLSDPCADPPITPNHLLTMKSTAPLPPPGPFVKEDLYARKRWRRVQYLLEQFWSRWKREYLLSLNERKRWNAPRRNLRVGDIVLIKDETLHRLEWPIAIVSKANPDADGLVRKASLTVATKNLDRYGKRKGELSVLHRPIQKLVVLVEAD